MSWFDDLMAFTSDLVPSHLVLDPAINLVAVVVAVAAVFLLLA